MLSLVLEAGGFWKKKMMTPADKASHGEVDVETPAPYDFLGEDAIEQWPYHGRDSWCTRFISFLLLYYRSIACVWSLLYERPINPVSIGLPQQRTYILIYIVWW